MTRYGSAPAQHGPIDCNLTEVMYYLYLPVAMEGSHDVRLPRNIECCRQMIYVCQVLAPAAYRYTYISARKGWASPDNPLNRPGWHADGFGTNDMNFVWWIGPGTRFAVQQFTDISDDHQVSLQQFGQQIDPKSVISDLPERHLYGLDPSVVHATPLIEPPGCMRQYIKISLSNHRYNLSDNSHNYLFDYDWPLEGREVTRNDTHTAQRDYGREPV